MWSDMLKAGFLKELEGKTIELVEENTEYPDGFLIHFTDGQRLNVGVDLKLQQAEIATYWEGE